MFKNRATIRTGFRCIRWGNYHDDSPSFYRFGFKSLPEVSPTGVHNALGQMPVTYHILNLQIFYGDQVVLCNQVVNYLIQEVLALIADLLMVRLQLANRLAPVRATLFASGYPALQDAEFRLPFSIPFRVVCLFAGAGGNEAGNTHVYPDPLAGFGQRLGFNLTSKTGKPLASLADYPQSFDFTFDGSMPAHCRAPDEGQFQSPSIQPESVSVFFVAKTIKSISALEPGITRRFPCLSASKERAKSLVHISGRDLQHVAVDFGRIGVDLAKVLHPGKLLEFGDRNSGQLVRLFALSQAPIVPAAAGLKGLFEAPSLAFGGVKAILKCL